MKKHFLFYCLLALIAIGCDDKNDSELSVTESGVATFENETGGIQLSATKTYWVSATPEKEGTNDWKSGDYTFYTYVDISDWGTFYYGFYASNETETTSTGWEQPYRSAKGGAFEGENFGVLYINTYNGTNNIRFDKPKTATGFYVTNNAYTVNSMANGDGFARKFEKDDDYLNLICKGKLEGKETGKTVTVKLAEGTKYIKEWTYVDLSELGQIDEVVFSMEGSVKNDNGLLTPAYFCLDNFGASKPNNYQAPAMSSLSEVADANQGAQPAPSLRKVVRNGQTFIIRGNAVYTLDGQRVK